QGEDMTSPKVKATDPINGRLVGFEDTSEEIKIMTDELSTCKWDTTNKEYGAMTNSMTCSDTYLHQSSPYGYVCKATVPITTTENKYYIRCMDQPWLAGTDEEEDRNANTVSYEYILRKPTQKISIDYVKPEHDFESSVDVNQIELEVKTSS